MREKLSRSSGKNIKVVFIPFILSRDVEEILSVIKDHMKPTDTIVIVNIFCRMGFPNQIYNSEIPGLVFLNLLLIANKKRLLEVLTSYNINNSSSDWLFCNADLVRRGMKFVGSELGVEYEPMDWKVYDELFQQEFKLTEEEESGFKKKQHKSKLFTHPMRDDFTWNEDGKGPIKQISVLQQRHENVCGFHALHCIKEYPNVENMRSYQK